KFGGAYRREILRVGEQHGPGIADPVVEANFSLGGLRLEIRRDVIDGESHHTPPSCRVNGHRVPIFRHSARIDGIVAPFCNLRQCATVTRPPHANRNSAFMSALGQKQTWQPVSATSALPPKADIVERDWHFRFVPKADICTAANKSAV